MYAFWEASEFAFQRHTMFRALRASSVSDVERLCARIHRLEEERAYSRPGWRVAVRRATTVLAPIRRPLTLWERFVLGAHQWLTHPLIDLGGNA
jgi:hypothetical protein